MSIRENIRFYLDLHDYFKHNIRETMPLQPMHMFIEPINVCNLDCPFCDTSSLERTKKRVDFPVFQKVISEVVDNGWHKFLRITLTGQGEPFLNKDMVKMVRHAKTSGIAHLEVITNGNFIDQNLASELIDSGINRVQFSIDSIKKESYDILRRSKVKGRSYYESAITNILNFIKLNEEMGHPVYISISAVLTSVNRGEKEPFLEFWSALPVDNLYFPPLSSLQDNSPSSEAERFVGDIKTKPVCSIPWLTMSVKADGDVVICSHDYHNTYPLGNVMRDKLSDIWNNQKALHLRRALLDADLEEFVSIGHDCIKCNNPCNGANIASFIDAIPTYMEKTVLGAYTKGKHHKDAYQNLLDAIGRFDATKTL